MRRDSSVANMGALDLEVYAGGELLGRYPAIEVVAADHDPRRN